VHDCSPTTIPKLPNFQTTLQHTEVLCNTSHNTKYKCNDLVVQFHCMHHEFVWIISVLCAHQHVYGMGHFEIGRCHSDLDGFE